MQHIAQNVEITFTPATSSRVGPCCLTREGVNSVRKWTRTKWRLRRLVSCGDQVLDFGLAKAISDDSARPTNTSVYASTDTSRCRLQDSRPGWIRYSPFL